MIRKLRKKFILAAVAAVFLVLLLLIGAINVLNFRSLVRDADSTLEILSQNGGRFPGQMFRPEDQPAEMIPPPQSMQAPPQDPTAPPDREELPDTGRKGPFGDRRGGFGELAYQSRYFTASFDSEGNVTVNLDNLASLTEDEARTLAAAVYARRPCCCFSTVRESWAPSEAFCMPASGSPSSAFSASFCSCCCFPSGSCGRLRRAMKSRSALSPMPDTS